MVRGADPNLSRSAPRRTATLAAVTQPTGSGRGRAESDEATEAKSEGEAEDNSLGRLLTLCDGVFAIAMTLLVFDLKVPNLGNHPSDASLRHALAHNSSSYLSFLVSFYVIASYWRRHRRLMRSVIKAQPQVISHTLFLLIIVSAMPYLASLLGRYGSTPFALSLYGAFNAAATLTLMQLRRDIRRFDLVDKRAELGLLPESWRVPVVHSGRVRAR
jgi:uncharacterized membrane protein